MNKESEMVTKLLNKAFWLEGVDISESYMVDDDDAQGRLIICFGNDGDAHIKTYMEPVTASLRVRTFSGGGRNHRTRTALMILALAMKMDSEGERNYADITESEVTE